MLINETLKPVNIMIGRFQPITYGHMKCINNVWENKQVPTILAMINVNEEKIDIKHPFPSNMLLPLYNRIFEQNPRIEKIILVKNANIVDIGEKLYQEGYQICSWVCGTDRIRSYQAMADKYKKEAHLSNDFKILEITRNDEDISATKVREALLNDDEKTFSSMTPLMNLREMLTENNIYESLREYVLKVH